MKKRLVLFFSLLFIFALSGGAIWRNAKTFKMNQAEASSFDREAKKMLDDQIDVKARMIKDADKTAIRDLADEVFASSYFSEAPAEILGRIKERVVAHEVKYRANKKGLKENDIVRMVNELAEKTGAPEYAKTSSFQVHSLRARLMIGYPNFISPANAKKEIGLHKRVGTQMNPEMSPLEAVFVAGVLLEQKMINEEFQHSPQDWETKLKKKELKNWQAGGKSRNSGEQGKPQLAVSSNL